MPDGDTVLGKCPSTGIVHRHRGGRGQRIGIGEVVRVGIPQRGESGPDLGHVRRAVLNFLEGGLETLNEIIIA